MSGRTFIKLTKRESRQSSLSAVQNNGSLHFPCGISFSQCFVQSKTCCMRYWGIREPQFPRIILFWGDLKTHHYFPNSQAIRIYDGQKQLSESFTASAKFEKQRFVDEFIKHSVSLGNMKRTKGRNHYLWIICKGYIGIRITYACP